MLFSAKIVESHDAAGWWCAMYMDLIGIRKIRQEHDRNTKAMHGQRLPIAHVDVIFKSIACFRSFVILIMVVCSLTSTTFRSDAGGGWMKMEFEGETNILSIERKHHWRWWYDTEFIKWMSVICMHHSVLCVFVCAYHWAECLSYSKRRQNCSYANCMRPASIKNTLRTNKH